MNKVAIVVTTSRGRRDFVAACLESIYTHAPEGLAVWTIVVDNASEGVADLVEPYLKDATLLRNESNEALAAHTHNQGMRLALGDPDTTHIVILNDDTWFTDSALARLVEAADANPDALLTPLQITYDEPYSIDAGAFESIRKQQALLEDALLGRIGEVYPLNTILGAIIVGRREVFDRIGFFEEMCQLYGLDDDYCDRANYLGYPLLLVPHSVVHHAHGRFAHTPKKDFDAWFWRWRDQQRARLLLQLKRPQRPFWMSYAVVTFETIKACLKNGSRLWFRGVGAAIVNYWFLVRNCGKIRQALHDDYSEARRCRPAAKPREAERAGV